MKIRNLILALMALAVCLTSCNKDDADYRDKKEGLSASISIKIPRITTYADDDNATSDEVKFKDVHVFIYDGATLETYETLDFDDFDLISGQDLAYESNSRIITSSGKKDVYVGLNLPAAVINVIKNSGIKAGLATAATISTADLTGSDGFAMFSTVGVEGNFVEDESQDDWEDLNQVSVTVARMVAKVTVQDGTSTKEVEGGKVSDLQFAMRNINKLIYPLQQIEGGVVKDPNWADGSYHEDDFTQESAYVNVNPSTAGIDALNNKYVPENTSEKHYAIESTYASLRVKFEPKLFVDEDGVEKISTWTSGTFWTVTFNDGTLNYFDDEDEAEAYALRNAAKGAGVKEYADGYCYYNLFINPDKGYNTLRNNYYKMTINSIKGLGNANPEDGGNTEIPVPTEASIDVSIDIQPWNLVETGYNVQ